MFNHFGKIAVSHKLVCSKHGNNCIKVFISYRTALDAYPGFKPSLKLHTYYRPTKAVVLITVYINISSSVFLSLKFAMEIKRRER